MTQTDGFASTPCKFCAACAKTTQPNHCYLPSDSYLISTIYAHNPLWGCQANSIYLWINVLLFINRIIIIKEAPESILSQFETIMSQNSVNCTAPVMESSPKQDNSDSAMGLDAFFDFIKKNFDTLGVKMTGWTFFALDRYKTIQEVS